MNVPRVSILLPTKNSRRFLDERLETIFAQTFSDWELVVADSYSNDGTWPILQSAAARNPRVVLQQTPADGIYPNWNRCLATARGELIYIATSDDTMSPDCLMKLVATLDAHPECGLAECCLNAIDEKGAVIENWWKWLNAARYLGPTYLRAHVRRAPIDGILHCAGGSIYQSVTQLLIRRKVFERLGKFPTTWGTAGDFVWGLRAGMTFDVSHVPEFLATWRVHGAQATAGYRPDATEAAKLLQMTIAGLEEVEALASSPSLPSRRALLLPHRFDSWRLAWAEARSWQKRLALLRHCAKDDWPTLARLVAWKLRGRIRTFDPKAYVHGLIESHGLADAITVG